MSDQEPFRPLIPSPAPDKPVVPSRPGYHMKPIQKGTFGDADKIFEEVEEFRDALSQNSAVMAVVELSDLYGAIEGYLAKHHCSMTMADLAVMSEITQRAFQNGHRD